MQRAGIAILLYAGASRILRAGLRWEEWALHYSAYNLEAQEVLQSGGIVDAMQVWAGLHPPGYPVLHSLLSTMWPAPAAWLLFSTLCSVGAVYFLLKAHPKHLIPGFLLATDPEQLHYAAEVNNYPLAALIVSVSWWALKTNRPYHLAAFAVLGFWTHIMAGVVCCLIAVSHRSRWSILSAVAAVSLPLMGPAWTLAADPGTQRQPELNLELSLQDALNRFGFAWIALIPMLGLGASRAPSAAIVWGGTCFFWVFMVSLGLAAPHQFPYAIFLGLPAAVLLSGSAQRSRAFAAMIVGVGFVRGLWFTGEGASQAMQVLNDLEHERGIDTVLNLSLPGDAIVLVRGPGEPDDDRRHYSPVLWRLSPFEAMPALFTRARPDLVGQPRMYRGRRIYTFAHPRPSIAQVPGNSVFTILYDGAEQNPERIPDHPKQGDWTASGPDLWRGPAASNSGP